MIGLHLIFNSLYDAVRDALPLVSLESFLRSHHCERKRLMATEQVLATVGKMVDDFSTYVLGRAFEH